jgi:Subtilase family/Fn3-like domain
VPIECLGVPLGARPAVIIELILDILAAAILRAAADGSDIITLSIGGSPNFQDTDVAVIAAEAVSKKGKIVLAAAGNAGSAGAYTGGTPGFGAKVIGVGSFDNVENPAPYVAAGGENTAINFGSQSPAFVDSFSLKDIVVNNLNAEEMDVQNDGESITAAAFGKPVLIRWGQGIGSAARCNNAALAGATHCILYDNVPGKGISANILGAENISSALISNFAGLSILKAVKDKNAVDAVVESSKFFDFPVPTSGTVSDFSSRGLDLELALKPNLAGVGGKVLSTISSYALSKNPQAWKTPYAVYSGTSMATPNLAGALALLLEHMKRNNEPISFEVVKAKLQNSANPGTIFDSLKYDSVIAQGAGLFNIHNAINKKTSIFPSEISLSDTARLVPIHQITITNEGTMDMNYVILHKKAASFAPYAAGDDAIQTYSSASLGNFSASVTFGPSRFTLKAGKSRVVKVKFIPPKKAPLLSFYSGFVQVVNEADEILTVPYAGVIGNYKSAPVLSRKSAMFDTWTAETLGVSLPTGFYGTESNKIGKGETLTINPNLTSFALVFPLYSTTTRYSSFNISYMGNDKTVLEFIAKNNLTRENVGQPWIYSENGAGIQDGQVSRYSVLPNQLTSPIIYLWGGQVSNGQKVQRLPRGLYKFSIYALRQFGEFDWSKKETEFDVRISSNLRFTNQTSLDFNTHENRHTIKASNKKLYLKSIFLLVKIVVPGNIAFVQNL